MALGNIVAKELEVMQGMLHNNGEGTVYHKQWARMPGDKGTGPALPSRNAPKRSSQPLKNLNLVVLNL